MSARPATRTAMHLPEGAAHNDSSSQAVHGSSGQRTASSISSVDQTVHFLLAAANPGRPWPKQVRARGRKCPLTTATHRPQTPGETACMHEYGSPDPRPFGAASSDMETSPLHRSTRDTAALASGALPLGLETEVKDCFSYAEGHRRNHRLDQRDGEGESTLGC